MREPPLIVHVVYRLAVGGVENGVVNLINHLPAGEYRHAVVSLTDASSFRQRIERDDVDVIELRKPEGNSLRLHRQLYRLFRRLRPAIVHTRNLAALEAQFAAALAGVPARIHGEHGWDVGDVDGRSRRHVLIRRLYGRFVHRFVALSAHLEEYLRLRVGIEASRIVRICNGVDCGRFFPANGSREHFPHPGFRSMRHLLVGTVGRLEPVKDQLTLARAFVQAIRQRPEASDTLRLVLVGEGSLRAEIEQVLADGGVRELAWLAGERGDIPQILQGLDVFVLPSRAEGISNTILEAMASGVPIVATNVGGNGELVDEGLTGTLVPRGDPQALADAILRYGSNPDLRIRCGIEARGQALARFSLGGMVARYAHLYRCELAARAPTLLAASPSEQATALVD